MPTPLLQHIFKNKSGTFVQTSNGLFKTVKHCCDHTWLNHNVAQGLYTHTALLKTENRASVFVFIHLTGSQD